MKPVWKCLRSRRGLPIALLLGCAFIGWSVWWGLRVDRQRKAEQVQQVVRHLNSLAPYPNDETIDGYVKELREQLSLFEIESEDRAEDGWMLDDGGIEMGSRVQTFLHHYMQLFEDAGLVNETRHFGFDEFAGEVALNTRGEAARRLTHELGMTGSLLDIILQCRPLQLVSVVRVNSRQVTGDALSHRRGRDQTIAPNLPEEPIRLAVVFDGHTRHLRKFLNLLAQEQRQLVAVGLHVSPSPLSAPDPVAPLLARTTTTAVRTDRGQAPFVASLNENKTPSFPDSSSDEAWMGEMVSRFKLTVERRDSWH